MTKAVVAIYIDPDFFPPTINAILNLSERVDEVVVISRNNSVEDYPYPENVKLKKVGKWTSVRGMEKQSVAAKLWGFLSFTLSLFAAASNKQTQLVVLYDPFALFSFFLLKRLRYKKKIWYHNHDIPNHSEKRFSLNYWVARCEFRAMRYIHYFSLPQKERLTLYPMLQAGIATYVIPNYPSLKVYKKNNKSHFKNGDILLIYQGFIGPGHGLEEIVTLLGKKIKGYTLKLVLKGSVTAEYKHLINNLAEDQGVLSCIKWEGIGGYKHLPSLTHSCDIGIGINNNKDIVSKTQGTASNKIYEYAASGLPVILNKDIQFTKYLGNYEWVYFTDGSGKQANAAIESIVENIDFLSNSASSEFEKTLNFEQYFIPVLNKIFNNQD